MIAILLDIIFVLVSVIPTGEKTYYLYEIHNPQPFVIYGCSIIESGAWFGNAVTITMPDRRDGATAGTWQVADPYRQFYVAAETYRPQPVVIETANGWIQALGPGCFISYLPKVHYAY